MARANSEKATRQVSFEICHSTLNLVVMHKPALSRPAEVHRRSIIWRDRSGTLFSQAGTEELTAGFKRLVAEQRLTGQTVRVALSGDFCVTRVLAGTSDRIRYELRQLEERAQLYLTLGPGHKLMAASVRQIDARHQHALLTIANEKTLDVLMHVAATVGLQIELVEPSLVAICRLIGELKHDHSEPILVLDLDEEGTELGISHGGQLLLDYRPGGRIGPAEIAALVQEHRIRLQRYCRRYFPFAEGELRRVLLCGKSDLVEEVHKTLRKSTELTVEKLEIGAHAGQWQFLDQQQSAESIAALGTCLNPPGGEPRGPNLLDDLHSRPPTRLLTALAKTFWPIAAALLLAATLFGVNQWKEHQVAEIERRLAALAEQGGKAKQLRLVLTRADLKSEQFQAVAQRISRPPWQRLLDTIATCLPEDVWLERFELTGAGHIEIRGHSLTENGVFEFVSWLEKAEMVDKAAVESTRELRRKDGTVTQFQVECQLAKLSDSDGDSASSGSADRGKTND